MFCKDDSTFGPAVAATACRDFDFTLTFESSILSILPSTIFLLFACVRLTQLRRKDVKVSIVSWSGKCLYVSKIAACGVAILGEILALASWATVNKTYGSGVTIAAFAFSFLASLVYLFGGTFGHSDMAIVYFYCL